MEITEAKKDNDRGTSVQTHIQSATAMPSLPQSTGESRSREIPTSPSDLIPLSASTTHSEHLEDDRNWTIKPADPTKPCLFAKLPTEVREMIYEFALPRSIYHQIFWYIKDDLSDLSPPLLQVSFKIRLEVAYVFYSRTEFQFGLDDFDFTPIKKWIISLPWAHQRFVSQNRRLVIHMMPVPIPYIPVSSILFWTDPNSSTLCRAVLGYTVGMYRNWFPWETSYYWDPPSRFIPLENWVVWCAQGQRDMKWSCNYRCWGPRCWAERILHGGRLNSEDNPCESYATVHAENKGVVKEALLDMTRDAGKTVHHCEWASEYEPSRKRRFVEKLRHMIQWIEAW